MNYEEASAVKELAAPSYEVLKRLDVECPNCHGKTLISISKDFKGEKAECPFCWGKKVKYTWQPQPGDYFLDSIGSVCIIAKNGETIDYSWNNNCILRHNLTFHNPKKIKVFDCVPILHWEEIERVLEKAGYIIKFMKNLSDKVEYTCFFNVADKDILDRPFRGDAKSRQKAIMLSVIELGKEL